MTDRALEDPVFDIYNWDKAQAEYTDPAGANASERALNRIAAAQRMGEIEARYESLPGGFRSHRDHIKRIVDGMPPLTDEQLVKLVLLLRQEP